MNPQLVEAISAGLRAFPGMRVGQLLDNVCHPPATKQLFYVTDVELIALIWAYIAKFGV